MGLQSIELTGPVGMGKFLKKTWGMTSAMGWPEVVVGGEGLGGHIRLVLIILKIMKD
jgi:hypothetical protein